MEQCSLSDGKVEKILKSSLDSVKIQTMRGKFARGVKA